ncbi:hypothetical protein DdX_01698 [Ditylenchus destructor]|uniref:Uncharacterized protein n=1 Tax=Ditylenchus destructor TaxID=166010 RepID=A0AAD4RDW7_9BILA|nr:hypothetical protein DdX_01698 [Ditylenchus destructor]
MTQIADSFCTNLTPKWLLFIVTKCQNGYIWGCNRLKLCTTFGAERRRGNRIVQLEPRFPPEMWSVYQRTLDGASRTNNYAEAAKRRIQSELGVCHPTLGNFILSLKKVQHGRDQQYMQWISGRRLKDKRRKYKDADKRILKILQEYQRNERTVIELLRGIAQNIVIDDVVGIDDEVENNE